MAAVLSFWSVLAIITEKVFQSADFTFDVLCTSGTLSSTNQPTYRYLVKIPVPVPVLVGS